MARPYFTGNYGASLARVDTSPIIEAGRAQGQMYANLGGQIGGMIKEYGLNKQKREKATREVEGSLRMDPTLVGRLTGTGDEAWDKKQNTAIEKLTSGDLNLRGIEGLAGDIARLEKQDKKEQDEAEMRSQIALDLLKREQIGLDMDVKKQGLAAQKESSASRERVFRGLQQDLFKAQAKLRNDPNAKLTNKERQLTANPEVVMNMQGDPAVFRSDPMEDQLKGLEVRGLEQGLDKGEFEVISAEQDVARGERELSAGAFTNWPDAAVKQEELWNLGFVTTAKINPNGGVDIVDQKPIADAEQANEFTEVKDFPGHFVRKGDSHLYRKDANGNLEQIGAPRDTQQMGQLQDAVDSMKDKFVTYYMDISGRGKLLKYNKNGKLLPKSKWVYLVEDLDEDDELAEKKVPYNEQHETTVRRIKAAQQKIDEYHDLDVTP